MKTCPFCKEQIQDTAVKCRYCGEFLTETDRVASAAPAVPDERNASNTPDAPTSPERQSAPNVQEEPACATTAKFPFKTWKIITWITPLFILMAIGVLKSTIKVTGSSSAGLDAANSFIGILLGITYFILASYVRIHGGKSGRFTTLALIQTIGSVVTTFVLLPLSLDPSEGEVWIVMSLGLPLVIATTVFYILCILRLTAPDRQGVPGGKLLGYFMLTSIALEWLALLVGLFYEGEGVFVLLSLLSLAGTGAVLFQLFGIFNRFSRTAGGQQQPARPAKFPFKAWKIVMWLSPLFILMAFSGFKSIVGHTGSFAETWDVINNILYILLGIYYFLLASYVRVHGGKSGRFTTLALLQAIVSLVALLVLNHDPSEGKTAILIALLIIATTFYILCVVQLNKLNAQGVQGTKLLGFLMLSFIVLDVLAMIVPLFYEGEEVPILLSLLTLAATGAILFQLSGMFDRLSRTSAETEAGKRRTGDSVWRWILVGLLGLLAVGMLVVISNNHHILNSKASGSSTAASANEPIDKSDDFSAFIKRFGKDEAFQRAHIVFPIEIEGRYGDASTFVEAEEWEHIPAECFVKGPTTIDGVTYEGRYIEQAEDKMMYSFAVPETDNGFVLTFEKIGGDWMMVGYR